MIFIYFFLIGFWLYNQTTVAQQHYWKSLAFDFVKLWWTEANQGASTVGNIHVDI